MPEVSNIDFYIEEISRGMNRDFGLDQVLYGIMFSDIFASFEEAQTEIMAMFENLVKVFTRNMLTQDKIRIIFFHDILLTSIDLPFVLRDNFTAKLLWDAFESVMQSYDPEYLNTDDVFKANVQIVSMPLGNGRRGLGGKKKQVAYKSVKNLLKINNDILRDVTDFTIQTFCNKKKSIIKIINHDNMCLLRAILVAIAYYHNEPYKVDYKKPSSKLMATHIKIIRQKLKLPEHGCGIREVFQIESFLEDYCITLIDGNCSNKFFYKGGKKDKYLYIMYTNSHYNVITSMPAYIGQAYYCDSCNIGYCQSIIHSCANLCNTCKKSTCNVTEAKHIKCENCYMSARDAYCLQRHLDLICNKRKICQICKFFIGRKHICLNEKYCQKCKEIVQMDHLCFIKQQPEKKKEAKFNGLIFFDYEAFVENSIHVPNLIIAHKVCVDCLDKVDMCKIKCQKICVDNNDTFCKWLFSQKDFIALAHNAKGYDSIFINDWINESINNNDSLPDFIRVGSKILSISFRDVKIICSLSFLPMPLDKFSSTFNLVENAKGFFPHLFNTRANQNYLGPYPPKEDYQPRFMNFKKNQQFQEWYSKISIDKNGKERIFDFKKEIVAYCDSDVEILRKGCLAFRKIIIDQTKSLRDPLGIDPFRRAITIASLCHVIYRNMHLIPETIAIVPENGFFSNQITSKKALCWLRFISYKQNRSIQHAKNFGEIQLENYRGDGYDPISNTVYEFHGCYYHGCLQCNSPKKLNTIKQMSFEALYNRHKFRIEKLKLMKINGQKINLVEIWEHDWDALVNEDNEVLEFLKSYEEISPLIPREAFYGGRTETFDTNRQTQNDEKIKYVDVTSLYPYVMKVEPYPIGHPITITENFKDINEYFGIIKLKILAPRGLRMPVLPDRSTGQLVFSLCFSCTKGKQKICNHSENERAFTGTWTTVEIKEALKQGYKVLKIYEVLHYNETSQYDPITRTGGIFTTYINQFLKMKTEASGYPIGCTTEILKDKYINDFLLVEGILLEKTNIKLNEGMRAIAKLMLNSFWGRFGMQSNKKQYKLIRKTSDWFSLISDDRYVVHDVDFTHKNYLQVYFSEKNYYFESTADVNVVLACFVCAYGRLKMLNELTKLDDRALYMDTGEHFFN
jgi:hypothetical protein